MLSGQVTARDDLVERDWRRTAPQFSVENLPRNVRLARAVAECAAAIGCTPAQAALAWVLGQGEDIVTIPGTKRVRTLEENVGAGSIELTREQVERLSQAVPPDAVAGDRYPEQGMRAVGH